MRRLIIGSLLASAFLAAGATGVASQDMMRGERMRGPMMGRSEMGMMGGRWAEDAQAFMDARIAALHAGLKLSADQEKLWPPVEDAIRNAARLHVSHMQAMRDRADDPIERLRNAADRMAQGSDAMRKLADAAAPLYATLDDAQKRRLRILVRDMGPRGMMGPGWRGMMGGRFDSDDRDERRGMMGQGSGRGMGGWFGSDDEDDDQ
jgi:zinc resistance-associated protein